ncbi:MAG: SH3 domain-containing protein [Cocleimonas sp.]|nr:SH3 domain-containing protein [Cocleimonas sp.]
MKTLRCFKGFCLIVGTLISLCSNTGFASPPYDLRVTRVEGSNSLNLRSEPRVDAAIKTYIPFNSLHVKYLNKAKGHWRYVQYAGVKGWVSTHYLAPQDIGGNRYYSSHNYHAPTSLKVRQSPNKHSDIMAKIPPSETVIQGIGYCRGLWCPVRYKGQKGWVNRRYIASWSP